MDPAPSPLAPAASRVLLTGFEPFDGETVNPSWEVARALDGHGVCGALVRAVRLPCVFGGSLQVLDEALRRTRPHLVLALGQASRAAIGVERVAVNLDDARIADNAGVRPVDVPVVAGAPAAYFSTLPVKAMALALREAGIAAEVSGSAGSFVCNHVFFGLMHRLRRRRGVRGGFVHLPMLPEQAARRALPHAMPLEVMVDGVQRALACALATARDVAQSEGRLD